MREATLDYMSELKHSINRFLLLICVLLAGVSISASACYNHMFIDPDRFGGIGGTAARMAGILPPKQTFDIVHPSMKRTKIGEKSEVVVNYSRPMFSKNVQLKVRGTDNVTLELLDEVALDERKGSVIVGYTLAEGAAFESILFTVSGEHGGEVVKQSSQIYLRAI